MKKLALVLGLLASIFAIDSLRSQTPEPLQSVYSTAALRALDLTAAPFGVERLSVSGVSGDAPPVKFMPDVNHVCSTDDGGYCVSAHGNGFWLAQYQGPADIREWGAPLDGITPAQTAINACLNSYKICFLPASSSGAYISTQVTVGTGEALVGSSVGGDVNSPTGSLLACANTAFNCLVVTGTGAFVQNIIVAGVAGTPVANANGIYLDNPVNANLDNVWSINHDTCIFMFGSSPPPPGGGIRTTIINPELQKCASQFWTSDGYPAVQVTGGRTGSYAGNDYNTTSAYILAENTTCTTGGCGPNGIYFTNHVFGVQTSPAPACFLSFKNFTASGSSDSNWKFIGSHIETISSSGAVICSDSTVTQITKIDFVADDFLNSGFNLFNVNAATQIQNIFIYAGCFGGNINLSPSSQTWKSIIVDGGGGQCPIGVTIAPTGSGSVNNIAIDHTTISSFSYAPASSVRSYGVSLSGDVSVTGTFSADWSGDSLFSTLMLTNNQFFGGVTLNAGSSDGELAMSSNVFSSTLTASGSWFSWSGAGNVMNATLTDTSTGNKLLLDPQKGIVVSGAGAASKYVCVDANNKIVISAAAC